jgi:predicted nucleotidyltransferase component of viral defense system
MKRKTIDEYSIIVWLLFEEIKEHYGEDEARRLFDSFRALHLTKRQIKFREDQKLLWQYFAMEPKPNVRRLAARLAKERGISEEAMERKIWRVVLDQRRRKEHPPIYSKFFLTF